MGTIVKQIFSGLWQILTYRGGWVKPVKNSMPVAAFLGAMALVIKSLALFVSYLLDPQTPLAFAFSSVAVELVSMLLGIGLVVLVARQRKLYPTMVAGLMYLATLSVFIGAIIGVLASLAVTSFGFDLGQMQSLWQVIAIMYMLWFVSSVLTIIKHGLEEKWWRAALLTVIFITTSHVVVAIWQRVFFPNIL
jgi:hypothetical protein